MLAISLGSGLSAFVNAFDIKEKYPFSQYWKGYYPILDGHERMIYLCSYLDCKFLVLSGKFHFYEGFSMDDIDSFYTRIMNEHSISMFVHTSASGALSEKVIVGNWYQIEDILTIPNLHIGKNKDSNIRKGGSINLPYVQYSYQQGPSLGTAAEYKMLHYLGSDIVGMSMLPASISPALANTKNYFLSLPVCHYFPFENIEEPSHEQVINIASNAVLKLVNIIKPIIKL